VDSSDMISYSDDDDDLDDFEDGEDAYEDDEVDESDDEGKGVKHTNGRHKISKQFIENNYGNTTTSGQMGYGNDGGDQEYCQQNNNDNDGLQKTKS
jgi:hypothetical protein